jgi:hypothetical protein
MPIAFPNAPSWVGYILLLLAASSSLRALQLWLSHSGSTIAFWRRGEDWMGLMELRRRAETLDWKLREKGSLQILDLKDALSDAGRLGTLSFAGRPFSNGMSDRYLHTYGRKKIGIPEWENLVVSPDAFINLECEDNEKTRLIKANPFGEIAFADIFVERARAIRWLKSDAVRSRGKWTQKEQQKHHL